MAAAEDVFNIASRLIEASARWPDRVAVHYPSGKGVGGKTLYKTWTFRGLDEESARLAAGLESIGVTRGVKTLLMVPPGFDFLALVFALFRAGAPPVLIDPGMGKKNLLSCVAKAAPEAMIAVPRAHLARILYPRYFRSVKTQVTAGRRWLWGGASLEDVKERGRGAGFDITKTSPDEMAAILFTTGSTGPPKGVVYTHGIFDAQVRLIHEYYGIGEDDVDFPVFPPFALFSVVLGASVVIPDMDPTKPAEADPARVAEQINDKGATFSFGSPALWKNVSAYCHERGERLPTLRKVLMAGAPVPEVIHRRLLDGGILPPGAETRTPFGATEALPVLDISGREILDETAARAREGWGVCVGRPLPGMRVEIIKITDEPVPEWDDKLLAPEGEAGEIAVSGPVVTREYYGRPEMTRLAKIVDRATGAVRHRMGDIGRVDEKGRVWFMGRKGHRVRTAEGTMFTVPCESVINRHPDVARSALVGVGEPPGQTPVMIVEVEKGRRADREALVEELRIFAESSPLTESITTFLVHPRFPVDVRHNAKIFREKLAAWAEGRLSR
ncbi:MAG: fatty acid CoA ligase family protein [Candidatus Nitrospinota bacterium M3_3B_026]